MSKRFPLSSAIIIIINAIFITVALVTKCNGSWLKQFCCWCLTQLIEASNSSSDEQDNEVDDTVSIISSTSGLSSTSTSSMSKSMSDARDGDSSSRDSSSTTTIDSTSKKAPSSLLSVLQQAKTSDLSRKRIIRNNLPLNGKKRKVSTGFSLN